ncbi:hypothetical protein [Variovorax guangxiensis]|uniref:hypothetical protein n=1 Tax=Variovorax guangxiensis TaxID=1775474 RepID=UPI002867640A|nr:hypothetical protein [Variovorax guangxiensis]MDR6860915.1 ABC-type phosphate transport system permease subunit [Variovorax guangxiensis]
MEDLNNPYRTLHFLVKHGDRVANGISLALLLLGPIVWLAAGWLWAVPVAIAAAAFLLLILRSYVEMVRVIVDMLLPK